MTMNPTVDEHFQTFSRSLFEGLASALSEGNESSWQISLEQGTVQESEEAEPARVKLIFSGGASGAVILECDQETVDELASTLDQRPAELSAAKADADFQIFIESVRAQLCGALQRHHGAVAIEVEQSSKPVDQSTNMLRVTLSDSTGRSMSFGIDPEPTLIASLGTSPVASHQDSSGEAVKDGISLAEPINLTLVMDVELTVTLRFGQRQLTLREVLDLTAGSVVELDRQVEEPVELLLDGKVIARGEAVVIDGNYGLRVTEVSQTIIYPAVA